MAERAGAVVLGPGSADRRGGGVRPRAARAVEAPLLVDADGLNAHAGRLELLRERRGPPCSPRTRASSAACWSSTPPTVAAQRLACARRPRSAAARRGLLKGDDTIVARRAGRWPSAPAGRPALATAGTGDVLSGLIGALLAKRLGPFEAAALGALAHARAGQAAAERIGADHVMAGDVIEALPAAL